MTVSQDSKHLSDAVIAFSLDGRFPEEIANLPPVTGTDLQPAIDNLEQTRQDLENEVHTINEETKEDVSSWVRNAKTLQEDIIRSKSMANDIVRQSEAPDVSGEAIQDAEEKAEFLNREVQYSQQLHSVLSGLRKANSLLNQVEQARDERRILDSLRLLEQSWTALDQVGVSKSCRAMRLLDIRSFELKSAVHEVFDQLWKSLIQVDIDSGKVVINDKAQEGNMSLYDAVLGLKAYKEVDERMEQFWRNIDSAIVSPRMDTNRTRFSRIVANSNTLEMSSTTDNSVESLLTDLTTIFTFLSSKLPPDLLQILTSLMMADTIPRLVQRWLNAEVPASLKDMDHFQNLIQSARQFCETLEEEGYSGFDELTNWVTKAPMTWLGKCRDTALDQVREKLTGGIGASKPVEKVEKQMVSIAEGRELTTTTGAGAAADKGEWGEEWGDAWDDDAEEKDAAAIPDETEAKVDEDDGADAWGWGEESNDAPDAEAAPEPKDDEDDGTDAWGWGDEDNAAEPEPKPVPVKTAAKAPVPAPAPQDIEQTRELVLRETYHISSMPEPVLELIFNILEDAASLTREDGEYELVAGTAPGLFALPTFALALFRAISPYYYSLGEGGNMFLYNDAMYLAERLADFAVNWNERSDLTTRAKTMLRLDNDIKTLQNFANRSYSAEMNTQKTVLQDLLGGIQDDVKAAVEAGTSRIQTIATTWESILARSVWTQAIGSLTDSLAIHLINEVIEMTSIGQEEAYNIADAIVSAEELDKFFLPSRLSGESAPVRQHDDDDEEIPLTDRYAPNWLRLKYLSQVLQSNLVDVKYLWCEGQLSLYFAVEEVVDLIKASFEDNHKTRETIREIQAKPALTEL